jgi:hypothetical protein
MPDQLAGLMVLDADGLGPFRRDRCLGAYFRRIGAVWRYWLIQTRSIAGDY